jgi:hypothetical protein
MGIMSKCGLVSPSSGGVSGMSPPPPNPAWWPGNIVLDRDNGGSVSILCVIWAVTETNSQKLLTMIPVFSLATLSKHFTVLLHTPHICWALMKAASRGILTANQLGTLQVPHPHAQSCSFVCLFVWMACVD